MADNKCVTCGHTWSEDGPVFCPKCKVNGHEAVDHPAHYNQGKIEVIDAIEDWDLNFHTGSAVKYIARAKYKGKYKEDLRKAIWYLQREVDRQ